MTSTSTPKISKQIDSFFTFMEVLYGINAKDADSLLWNETSFPFSEWDKTWDEIWDKMLPHNWFLAAVAQPG